MTGPNEFLRQLKNQDGLEKVEMEGLIKLHDGTRVMHLRVYFPPIKEENPPDLGIHVSESVSAEDHFGGAEGG